MYRACAIPGTVRYGYSTGISPRLATGIAMNLFFGVLGRVVVVVVVVVVIISAIVSYNTFLSLSYLTLPYLGMQVGILDILPYIRW